MEEKDVIKDFSFSTDTDILNEFSSISFLDGEPTDGVPEVSDTPDTLCQIHQIKASFYCKDCKTIVCDQCTGMDVHKIHEIVGLDEMVMQFRRQLHEGAYHWLRCMRETQQHIKNIGSTLRDIEPRTDQIRNDIKKRYGDMRKLLDENYSSLMDDLDSLENKRKKELLEMREDGEAELELLKEFKEEWDLAKTLKSDCDIVEAAIDLTSRTEKVSARHQGLLSAANIGKAGSYKVQFDPVDSFRRSDSKNLLGSVYEVPFAHLDFCPDWNALLGRNYAEHFFNGGEEIDIIDMVVHKEDVYMIVVGNDHRYRLSVRKTKNLREIVKEFPVPHGQVYNTMAFNDADSCLYIGEITMEPNPGNIQRIDTRDGSATCWWLGDGEYAEGISITLNKNILVSVRRQNFDDPYVGWIDECDCAGQCLRRINLGEEFFHIRHSVELASGNFIVLLSVSSVLGSVFLVDPQGNILQNNELGGEDFDRRYMGTDRMFLDQRSNLLIVKSWIDQYSVLNGNLELIGHMHIETNDQQPLGIITCGWDKLNGRMVVCGRNDLYATTRPQITMEDVL